MKKILLAIVLVAAVTAVAQTASAPAPSAPQQSPQPAPQKKEIKDTAEYNAYVGAIQQSDPAAKISGFEAFLTQYPNSVMKEESLEQLMGAYQQTGNQPKALETAGKLLQVNPCNLRGLALLAYTKRALAEANQNPQQNLTEAAQAGEKGMQCLQTAVKPDGTPDADFQKFKTQTSIIFNGSAGIAALQNKDYPKAQQYLRASVEGDPTNLRDVYPLALAYVTPTDSNDKAMSDGLFFVARAANLAQGPGKDQIAKFGKSKYNKYHGSEEGWNDVMTMAATATLPPAGFAIKRYVPPTPAEQAHELVNSKKVEEMSFAEWQLVLSEGTPEDADKVWSALKGKPLQMVAQIISVTPTQLMLAGSQDDIDKKAGDIDLTMAAAIPARQLPKEGADLQFEATPVSYTAKPFMMTMKEGVLLVKAAPPAHKPPVHRKPPTQ